MSEVMTNEKMQQGSNSRMATTTKAGEAEALAVKWLTESGVQFFGDNEMERGGFCSWYEADTQKYPFIYSEITGYLLTYLSWQYAMTGNEALLEKAMLASDWLIRTRHPKTCLHPCIYPLTPDREGFKKGEHYAFDNGIILNGFVSLYRESKREKDLAAAVTVANWLISKMQREDGSFHPVWKSHEHSFYESDREWSLASGSYHSKIAIGLLNLYDLTEDTRFRAAAESVCNYAMRCQNEAGAFVSFLDRGGVNAHPHNYTCEALWVAGRYLGRQDYMSASYAGLKWILSLQNAEGFVPRLVLDGKPIYHARIDALSQTLRMGLLHKATSDTDVDMSKLEKIYQIITQFQAKSDDKRVNGGFYFGALSSGEKVPHVNVWVTSFASQALHLWNENQKSGKAELKSPFFMV